MIDQQQIHTTLSAVIDPELEHSIVQLGMVNTVKIDGARLEVALKLPLPGSPGEEVLISNIKSALSKIEGVKKVDVTTEMMNSEERTELANRLHGRAAAGPSSSVSPKAQSEASALLIAEDGSIAEVDSQRKAVGEALSKVMDPEIHLPLTQLGMIKALGIADGDVYLDILLTVPGCPLKDKITNDVTNEIKQNSWVKNVGINFGVMTEQQRQRVAEIVRGNGSKNPSSWKQPVNAGAYADRVIAVCSGKGGVGKSTTTTNLAFALASKGYKVGILDADVYGFSIPRMSGIHGEPQVKDEKLVPIKKGKVQVMSMGYFIDEDAPVIWRGPMLHKAINQFLADVTWDKLDFLLIDLPPGTGDVTLTIAQALPKAEMLIVTTPQPVATHVAGRVAQLAERTKLQLLGVVENMSYFEVDGKKQRIFGEGGGKELAEKLKIPFLGEIPLHQTIRERADVGNPVTTEEKSEIARAYFSVVESITAKRATPVHA